MAGSERTTGPLLFARRCLPLLALACFGLAAGQQTAAVDVAGVRFEERARIGTAEALLNGAGLRSVLGVKLYTIAIYLPQKQDSLEGALRSQGAKRIQIVNMFDVHAEMFSAGLVKGIRKNLKEAEYADLRGRVETLRAAVRAIDHSAAGSVISFDWLPAAAGGGGITRLAVNGLQRGEDIAGEDFFQALLKVWLGGEVNDPRLRDALFGIRKL